MINTTFHHETFTNHISHFDDTHFDFKDIKSVKDEDISILEAEFLEPKENSVQIFKRTSEIKIATLRTIPQIIEEIFEINKILSGSYRNKTEINAKENIRLSNLFIYRDYWSVKQFLTANMQLRDLLFETYYKLKEYFGISSEFILELIPDIYEPNFEQLFIRVIFKEDFKKGLEILDLFEKDSWFERTAYLLNSPVITLE